MEWNLHRKWKMWKRERYTTWSQSVILIREELGLKLWPLCEWRNKRESIVQLMMEYSDINSMLSALFMRARTRVPVWHTEMEWFTGTKARVFVLKALCSLLNGIMEQCDDGHSGQDREENFTQYSSCTAGKYDTVSTGMSITSAIITAEKKHGTLGREAEADHPQVRRLAMCKYEIIILLKMSHHFIFLLQRALFIQHYSSSCTTMGIM